MIKIRLTDPSNMKCFSGLLQTKDLLREYSIDITDSSDYDYERDPFLSLKSPKSRNLFFIERSLERV